MKKRILFQVAVLALIAVLVMPLVFSGIARADDGGDRDTSVNVPPGNGGYFTVDSQSTNMNGPRNEYNMVFAGNSFLMQFKNNSQQAGYDLQFSIQLQQLLLVGNNSPTQLLNFSQQEFRVTNMPSNINGLQSFVMSAESDLATFGMMVQATNAPTYSTPGDNASSLLTPNEVKISFYIHLNTQGDGGLGMQTQALSHDTVLLQLGVGSGNATMSGINNLGQLSQLDFTSGGNTGYFSWANNAMVGNASRAVNSSLSGQNLVLSYPAAANIVHDPSIGISPGAIASALASSAGNIVIYAVTIAFSAALIGGSVAMRRRRQ